MTDRSQMGKKSRRQGKRYEQLSADFWSKEMEVQIIRCPGSGQMVDLPGDLLCLKECILQQFVIDVKTEKHLLPNRLLEYYYKNKEDALGKPAFLEIYVYGGQGETPETFVFISRKDFARLLVELEGFRKNEEGKQ